MTDDFARRAMRQANTDNFKEALPEAIEGLRNVAILRYHNFKAHQAAGFSYEESLLLCTYFHDPKK